VLPSACGRAIVVDRDRIDGEVVVSAVKAVLAGDRGGECRQTKEAEETHIRPQNQAYLQILSCSNEF
jgi:hypothetical protein